MKQANKLFFIPIIFFLIFLTSCKFGLEQAFYRSHSVRKRSTQITELSETNPSDSEKSRFKKIITTIQAAEASDKDYNVLVFSDIHFGAIPHQDNSLFFEYLDTVKEKPEFPSFAICLGDIAETGRADEYNSYVELTNRLYDQYGLVTVAIPGNHDLFNDGIFEFLDKAYPYQTYFRISTASTSFYFLDSANGTLGQKQFNDLRSRFKTDKNKKIIFSHYPLFTTGDMFQTTNTRERAILLTEFNNNNVKAVYTGHHHPGGYVNFGNFFARGVKGFNEFNEFTVFTVSSKSVTDKNINENFKHE